MFVSSFLLFFSFIYWLLYILNSFLFKIKVRRRFNFSTFVISVGNLSFGGAGKTPMIEFLSEALSLEGVSHSIVSRGYGRKLKKNILVSDKNSVLASVSDSGDEPLLLARKLSGIPVAVGNKIKNISMLLRLFSSRAILIDDGFQSFSISRDLDIVLIDVSVPFHKYRLFPSGFLREPPSQISRSDVVVFTKCNYDSGGAKKIKSLFLKHINKKQTAVFESSYKTTLLKYSYKDMSFLCFNRKIASGVVAFCGIAQPNIFITSLSSFCENIVAIKTFSDHNSYNTKTIRLIRSLLQKHNCSSLITTRKDFVKIEAAFHDCQIYILEVKHQIENINSFRSYLKTKIIPSL